MERRSAYAANKTWDVSVPTDNKHKQPQSQCCRGVTLCSLLGNKRGSSQRSSRAESERDFMSFTKSYFLQLTWHGLFKVRTHDGSFLIHRTKKKKGKHEARTSLQASFLSEPPSLFFSLPVFLHLLVNFQWIWFWSQYWFVLKKKEKSRTRTQRAIPLTAAQQGHFIYIYIFHSCKYFSVVWNWVFLCNWPPVAFSCKYSVRNNDSRNKEYILKKNNRCWSKQKRKLPLQC